MKYATSTSIMAAAAALVVAPGALGFAPSTPVSPQISRSMTAAFPEDESPYFEDDDDEQDEVVVAVVLCKLPTQRGKKMSESIPFLQCPAVLRDSDLAGNVGFDPLGLAKNKEQLWNYREAEVKHARLAMLAGIGWPVSELMDRSIAEFFHVPALLENGDRAPTVLNGGMSHISPKFWGFCLGLSASIDMYGLAKARRGDPEYFPGNLGFDPLNFYPEDKLTQERFKLAEIKHGRTAMLGVLGYVVEEYITKMAVVDDTPILFQPITETVEGAVIGAIAAEEAFGEAIAGAL